MADSLPKVSFKALEGRIPAVTAAFDPATLVIVKAVAWTPSPTSTSDRPELGFSRGQGRRLSLVLRLQASAMKPSVQGDIDALMRLAMVINATGAESQKRPPLVELAWPTADALPAFGGVIDRVEVRYLGILADGTPQKADVLVEMEEASRLSFRK